MTNLKSEEKLREEFVEFFKSMSLDFHYKGDIEQAARWWLEKMAEQRKQHEKEMVEKIKALEPKRPVNSMMRIVDALRKEETLSEGERRKIQNKDNGFYIENVEYVVKCKTLTDVLSLINQNQ